MGTIIGREMCTELARRIGSEIIHGMAGNISTQELAGV